MVEGGPHDEVCRPIKSEQFAPKFVDRLARALATVNPHYLGPTVVRRWECPVVCTNRKFKEVADIVHAPDCAYVWAVEHVATLGDQ